MVQEEQGVFTSPALAGTSVGAAVWKRTLDWALIVLALPLWAPLMLAIGLAIKFLSPGPMLFKQERVGFRGRRFTCLKFRTMKCNADTTTHEQYLKQLAQSQQPMTKLDSADPRLIPGGAILRATGLDELPQLFNVLQGDMSLVGPRPCTTYEYATYHAWHLERFEALPGLTGLWQVSGKNKTTFEEMMLLDIHYARNQSLGLDVKIIFKTPLALLVQVYESRVVGKPQPAVPDAPLSASALAQYESPSTCILPRI
jgi:lipopolysaccharide/colanic/teichoic acid biosynthesis glycosyltransferase